MVLAPARVDIPALKARHSLGAVVEEAGVMLRGRGRVRQGVCPFHEEDEGSFTVYGDSERFYCFGCGAGGDVLDFVQRIEGIGLPEAIRRLDGAPHPTAPPFARRTMERSKPGRGRGDCLPPRDPALLTAAARHYAGQLPQSSEAMEFLASRGIGPGAARRLGLGYSPGHGLGKALENGGFSSRRIRDSGLLTGRGAERFAGMVTVLEVAGGLVRWIAGRAVDPGRTPRFQAPPGPRPVLGLGRLGAYPPWAVLTEGVFDWLALASWGIPSCAALGTQGLERVAAALRHWPRVFVAFDSDEAGLEATARLAALLGRRAAVVTLPRGTSDVAELASTPRGRSVFLRLLARAAHSAR